jgi:hypothetical protein
MSVKLNSTGGGSVTLDSPSTASNYTVTLPSAAGTLATTTGTGSVFTNPTINGFTGDTSAITIGTTQFVKDTSGNIGIGTATPANKVHISGDGSASLLKVQATNTNGTASINLVPNGTGNGQIYTESGALLFSPSNTERARLDSAGNLGLGVTPSAWRNTGPVFQNSAGALWSYSTLFMFLGQNYYYNSSGNRIYLYAQPATEYQQYNGSHTWSSSTNTPTVGGTVTLNPSMTLDASGNLLIGVTSYNAGVNANFQLFGAGNGTWYTGHASGTTSGTTYADFRYSGTTIGSISQNGTTAVLFNVTSDQRLKENIVDAPNALSSINAIKVRSFDWKADGSHSEYGYIAQELLEVAPEAVHIPEDPEEMMGVDFGKLTPRLVKAIQELSAQNNALEARLAQLEAK